MTSLTFHAPGSVAFTLRAIEGRFEDRPEDVPHASRVSLAEVLGRLLDLPGTVRLSDSLDVLAEHGFGAVEAHQSTGILRDSSDEMLTQAKLETLSRLAMRLDARRSRLRRELEATFVRPFRGRFSVPGPEGTFEILGEYLADRSDRQLAIAIRSLVPAYRDLFGRTIGFVRAEVRAERTELGAELRTLGRRATALEGLDQVVARSMAPGISRLLLRAESRLERALTRDLRRALRELPEGDDARAAVNALFVRPGVLRAFLDDARTFALEWLEHEWRSLDGLLYGARTTMRLENDVSDEWVVDMTAPVAPKALETVNG